MKNHATTLALAVAGVALAATCAQAQVTVTWAGQLSSTMSVTYKVVPSAGGWDYIYTFTSPAVIGEFEVDGNFVGATYVSGGTASTPYILDAVSNGSIEWFFNPNTLSVTAGTSQLEFWSPNAPTLGYGSAIDHAYGPYSPGQTVADYVAVPGTPIPEASTVLAGLLMVVPLGVGAVRAIRKDRVA